MSNVQLQYVFDTFQWAAFNGGLSAGYIMRAEPVVPKMDTSGKAPWFGGGGSCCNCYTVLVQLSFLPGNYILDLINLSVRGFNTDSLQLEYSNKKHK